MAATTVTTPQDRNVRKGRGSRHNTSQAPGMFFKYLLIPMLNIYLQVDNDDNETAVTITIVATPQDIDVVEGKGSRCNGFYVVRFIS
jgi:hypothetical protein